MTNEMQLAQAAGLTGPGQELVLAAQNQPPKPMGIQKIHRLLRGRYPLVITLGILFAIAGGILGYLSQRPLYTGICGVLVDQTIITVGSNGEPMPGYDRWLQSLVFMITNDELIQRAMDKDEWKAVSSLRGDAEGVAQFSKTLDAEIEPGTDIIKINFNDPDRDVALAGVQAICSTFQDFYRETDPLNFNDRLSQIDRERTDDNRNILDLQNTLANLAKVYNTGDLSTYQAEAIKYWQDLGIKLGDAKAELSYAQALLGNGAGANDSAPGGAVKPQGLSEDQIAAYEPALVDLRKQRTQLQQAAADYKASGYGPANPRVQQLEARLGVINNEINSFVQTYNAKRGSGMLPVGGAGNMTSDARAMKIRIQILQQQFDDQKKVCEDVATYMQSITDTKAKLDNYQADLAQKNAEYATLKAQQDLNTNHQMRISRKPYVDIRPSIDRRKPMAVLGFLGGGLLPGFIILLVGLLDGRFRYSDETNTDLPGAALLGLLPNLPDLLTDPSQAATAAHCVHQIRTILQITGQSVDRRVFAVTSASPGDGKTSLTLALGLSFAASGSRTLLVDGDLIGGGLTARLNVTAEHGVLEAMASRDIKPFIRTTDVADLSFLPVGQAMGAYTGTISPAAVRRLVNEARNHYDVILIDTGPILGSIEASPVAVACDAVVLCVARGQQRQLVDRALAHLKAIGAKLAGVVFNRAQAQDFARSTNRLGLGSLASGNGNGRPRGEAIGPVARAVASSVRSAAPGR